MTDEPDLLETLEKIAKLSPAIAAGVARRSVDRRCSILDYSAFALAPTERKRKGLGTFDLRPKSLPHRYAFLKPP